MGKIEKYSFGTISIEGQTYSSDVIVSREGVKANWRRRSGHSLCMEDLEIIASWDIEILLVGTGSSGMMSVPERVISDMKSKGVILEADPTGQAVRKFNEYFKAGKKVAGAFHLTC